MRCRLADTVMDPLQISEFQVAIKDSSRRWPNRAHSLLIGSWRFKGGRPQNKSQQGWPSTLYVVLATISNRIVSANVKFRWIILGGGNLFILAIGFYNDPSIHNVSFTNSQGSGDTIVWEQQSFQRSMAMLDETVLMSLHLLCARSLPLDVATILQTRLRSNSKHFLD
jgi:hypothetical protein